MSEPVTVARPYSKAAFEFAVEHQDIERWYSMLKFSAEISRNKQIAEMLSEEIAYDKVAKIFIAICEDELNTFCQNLIRLMAKNRRLALLPYVFEQFILLYMAQDRIVTVDVISASSLKEEQLIKISASMEHRLSCKVKLNCKIDKSIVAGLIIRTGDLVIDGSVRGRLERLADVLQI
ncbi:MAG: F0F1 ATP synthase subunit delta [Sodalis sp. (in: enterobacteria)]